MFETLYSQRGIAIARRLDSSEKADPRIGSDNLAAGRLEVKRSVSVDNTSKAPGGYARFDSFSHSHFDFDVEVKGTCCCYCTVSDGRL